MLALVLTVPAGEVELASDALWALGVVAVEERDPRGSSIDDHFVELWTSLGDDVDGVTRAAEAFPARWRWHLAEIDETVADTWRAHVVATWVESDLVVIPAWLDMADPTDAVVLRIEPGATFGLGDHPTTMLTMRALRRSLFPGAAVIDVGCGSGVLSVAACLLGAGRAEAIDISPTAVPTTIANAQRNGVGPLIMASTMALSDVAGQFDLVLANILAPALVSLADDLKRVLAPSGVLIISGVLADRHDHVVAALQPLHVIDTHVLDGWAAITLRW
jgi:ribosomal protein L11 methyltransferase